MLIGQAPPSVGGNEGAPPRVQAKRTYVVGTTESVKEAVRQQTAGHSVTVGDERKVAEVASAPPACGLEVQSAFARYCTSRLKVALAPCTIGATHVLCSTVYLTPPERKVYWRLRYRHDAEEVTLDLEALRRDPVGRPEDVAPQNANEFEELFDLLLKASRCEDGSR